MKPNEAKELLEQHESLSGRQANLKEALRQLRFEYPPKPSVRVPIAAPVSVAVSITPEIAIPFFEAELRDVDAALASIERRFTPL